MKISYLGSYFEQDIFPMRGIAQSIMREYCRKNNIEYNADIIIKDFESRLDDINNSDLVFINIDAAYEKEVYELISKDKISTKIIAISTELFDILFRKSNYDYFNYSGSYVLEKLKKYNIISHLSCTISGSLYPLVSGLPHIYYPYLLAPSVYEDKIPYLRNLFSSDLRISSEFRESCCAVYKSPTEFRTKICDDLEKFVKINYAGKWRNNDNRVKFGYDFDIVNQYYKKFKYVVSIENDFHPGWITEKLINPLIAGSIPIYYAPFEFPNKLINPDACIILNDTYLYKDNSILESELRKDRSGVKVFSDVAMETFEFYVDYWMESINVILNSNKHLHID